MQYGDDVGDIVAENSGVFSVIQITLVTVSKGILALKLCSDKILQFLTRVQLMQVNGYKMVVVD